MPHLSPQRRAALEVEILRGEKGDKALAEEFGVDRSLVHRRRARLKESTPVAALATSTAASKQVQETQLAIAASLQDTMQKRRQLLTLVEARIMPLRAKVGRWLQADPKTRGDSPLNPFEDQALAAYTRLYQGLLDGVDGSAMAAHNLSKAGEGTQMSYDELVEVLWPDLCEPCRLKLESKWLRKQESDVNGTGQGQERQKGQDTSGENVGKGNDEGSQGADTGA